ncbi:MAG: hypothetical protein NTZ56_23730 [Acidobacteria bacterium]|nr:hypothetical protein [Acidobacteriota bacterium]
MALIIIIMLIQAQPTIRIEGIIGSSVQVLGPADAEFQTVIASSLSTEARTLLQPILRYAVILRNNSPRPLAGATVVWLIRNQQGREVTHTFSHQSILLDPRVLIHPGEMLLMGPERGVSRKIVSGRPAQLAHWGGSWKNEQLFGGQRSILIRLDSAISDDGVIIGRDEGRRMLSINETLRAEADLTAEMAKLDDTAVERFLRTTKEHSEMVSDSNFGSTTAYHYRLAELSALLLRVSNTQGIAKAREIMVASSKSHKIGVIHRKGDLQ